VHRIGFPLLVPPVIDLDGCVRPWGEEGFAPFAGAVLPEGF
jgi:hypothetical protein